MVLASRERELSRLSGFEASHLSASPAIVMAEPTTGTQVPWRILDSSTASQALASATKR